MQTFPQGELSNGGLEVRLQMSFATTSSSWEQAQLGLCTKNPCS